MCFKPLQINTAPQDLLAGDHFGPFDINCGKASSASGNDIVDIKQRELDKPGAKHVLASIWLPQCQEILSEAESLSFSRSSLLPSLLVFTTDSHRLRPAELRRWRSSGTNKAEVRPALSKVMGTRSSRLTVCAPTNAQ